MTTSVWRDLLGHDFDSGDTVQYDRDTLVPIPGYSRADIVRECRRVDIVRGHHAHFTVGLLNVDARILFYIMTHIFFPRAHNHGRVLEIDWVLMWAILHNVKVNRRHFICWIMYKARHNKPKGALPYAFLVQRILEHFGVPMDTEELKENTQYNAQFGQRLLERCGILKMGDEWLWHTQPQVEVPIVEPGPVDPVGDEADDDSGDGDDVQEMVEPQGGWTMSDVMRGIHDSNRRMVQMEQKQKKRWKSWVKKGNERFRHIVGRLKGLEAKLAHVHISEGAAAGDDDDDDDVSDEEDEEEDSDDTD